MPTEILSATCGPTLLHVPAFPHSSPAATPQSTASCHLLTPAPLFNHHRRRTATVRLALGLLSRFDVCTCSVRIFTERHLRDQLALCCLHSDSKWSTFLADRGSRWSAVDLHSHSVRPFSTEGKAPAVVRSLAFEFAPIPLLPTGFLDLDLFLCRSTPFVLNLELRPLL
jgi:hypothetical protein